MLCSLFTFCSVLKSQPPKWLYQLLLPQIVGTLTSHMLFGHNVTFPAADYLYSRWNWVSSKVWSQSVQSLSRVRLFSRVRPHELQHARLLCPSTTPRACSNSSIESVMPSNCLILCCPLPLPPSVFASIRVFSSESVLTSGSQSIGVSASTVVFPMNIQDCFPLGLTGWISLQSKGLSRVFSNTTVQKHQFFGAQLSL